MLRFSSSDGSDIQKNGLKAIKKPNPVYMIQVHAPFTVQTNEGELNGKPEDYVAHDPISGHVWPVSKEYVAQHYDFQR